MQQNRKPDRVRYTRDHLKSFLNLSLEEKTKELKRNADRHYKMIEEVEDYAIILLDQNGTILNWNKGAEKIKGYQENEIVGKSFEIFYREEDRVAGLPQKLIKEAAEKGKATHEGWRVRKDGGLFWASIVITALHDKKNNIIGFSKVTRDLTERKAAEDRLKQYANELENKNQELEQFTYIVSHDFREPLRKIAIFSEMVKQQDFDALSDESKKKLERINDAAVRLNNLMEQLLGITKLTKEQQFTEVDLNHVIKQVTDDLELLIDQKQAKVHFEKLPVVYGIPSQMQQLFYNLLSNALKFVRPEAAPEISITSEDFLGNEGSDSLNLPQGKQYYRISVQDNGIGFGSDDADKIFALFKRAHSGDQYEGSGIGLALCKRIALNHGGNIHTESVLGRGSIFHVIMPK